MPNKDFHGRTFNQEEIFNEIAIDTDDDNKPDAIGVANADGSSVGTSAIILDDMESLTPWGLIAAYAGDNLALSTTHKIGTTSLAFDKVAGNVRVGAERVFTIPKDLGTAEATRKSVQFMVYMSALTNVASAWIRLGTDATNYAEIAIPVADLTAGVWNRISIHLLDTAWTQTGTGLITSALTYLAVGVTFDAAGNTLANILYDNVVFLEHVEVESKVLLSVPVTLGSVKIEDGNSGLLMDVAADGGDNAAFVQSNSMALAAQFPAALGQKTKAGSTGVTLPSDQVVNTGNLTNVLDGCEVHTDWTVQNAATNLAVSTVHRCGEYSIEVDKDNSNVDASIYRTITSVDIRDFEGHCSHVFLRALIWVDTADIGKIDYLYFMAGSAAANNIEVRLDGDAVAAGWNVLERKIIANDIVQNGTGIVDGAVTYLQIGAVTENATDLLTNLRFDHIMSFHGRESSIVSAPTSQIDIGTVRVRDRNSSALLDVGLDSAAYAAFVQSESMAQSAQFAARDITDFEDHTDWTLIGDGDTKADTAVHVRGTNAVSFNKIAGGTTVGIERTITSVDLSSANAHPMAVIGFQCSTFTDITQVDVRVGTDNGNYNEYTIASHYWNAAAWTFAEAVTRGISAQLGVGADLSAITYVAIVFTFGLAADTLAAILVDHLITYRAAEVVISNRGEQAAEHSVPVVPDATTAAKLSTLSGTVKSGSGAVTVDGDIVNLECMEAITGWSAIQDAASIATTDEHHCGAKALTWDKDGGTNVLSMIQKTITSVSIGIHPAAASVQTMVYLPALTDIENVIVRIGTDASNYAQYEWAVADLVAGWNILAKPITGRVVPVTGTGVNTAAITYVAVGIETDDAADTVSGIIADNLISFHSLETVLRQSPITLVDGPVNLGSVTLKDRNSGRQADIEADGSENAVHVKSNSLATQATVAALLEAIKPALPTTYKVGMQTVAGNSADDIVYSPTAGKKVVLVALIVSVKTASVDIAFEWDKGGGDVAALAPMHFDALGGLAMPFPGGIPCDEDTADLLMTTTNGATAVTDVTALVYEIE